MLGDSPLGEAFAGEHMLSDDPYVDGNPTPWLDHRLYLPDLGLGRLVETPEEIQGAVQAYLDADGLISTAGVTTTGYDFMKDGASGLSGALRTSLQAAGGTAPVFDDTINDNWTKQQLLSKLSGAPAKRVNAIYAHYDFDKALTASGYTNGTDVLTPDELANALPSGAQLLISMGCHSGLSVPDGTLPGNAVDFPQRLQQRGAAYVGVTGFGYGDLATAGLHERLLVLYGEQLGYDQDLGAAMRSAKQRYFAQQGLYGNADEKVTATTTLFGLPMYRLGTPGTAPPVPGPAFQTPGDESGGVSTLPRSLTPTFTRVDTPVGDFYRADGQEPQVTPGRPIQPRVVSEVTARTEAGGLLPAHGALITGLSLRPDEPGFDAAFTRPVTDLAANEPERPFSETTFPSSLAHVTTYDDPQGPASADGAGTRQNLVMVVGQFLGDGTPDASGTGVQRTFDDVDVEVQYSQSTDYNAPRLGAARGVFRAGGTPQAEFEVEAEDGSGIRRVLVMWRTDGDYQPLSLTEVGGVWRGTAALPAAAEGFEYFMQVVDGAGNVATASGKGSGLQDQPPVKPPPPPGVSADDASAIEGNGAGTTTVDVLVTLAAPSSADVSVPWSLQAGTATAGTDFVDASGTVTVPAGSLSATVPVQVQRDGDLEPVETFRLKLQGGAGYDLVDDTAVVTIVDDDTPTGPQVSVGDVTVSESSATALVPVTLSTTASSPVTVAVRTLDGTATAGADYTAKPPTTTVTIPAGQTSATVSVDLIGDTRDEIDETFTVRATSATGPRSWTRTGSSP